MTVIYAIEYTDDVFSAGKYMSTHYFSSNKKAEEYLFRQGYIKHPVSGTYYKKRDGCANIVILKFWK